MSWLETFCLKHQLTCDISIWVPRTRHYSVKMKQGTRYTVSIQGPTIFILFMDNMLTPHLQCNSLFNYTENFDQPLLYLVSLSSCCKIRLL